VRLPLPVPDRARRQPVSAPPRRARRHAGHVGGQHAWRRMPGTPAGPAAV